ncbi:MAG TPA: ATP-binding cassette domain-containing protein [Phycisphaerae bacterium]|nr:ATP-binding cassette domain-containing protein [Phycisphaerae bacterium]HNU44524.1 ATP-binding cassette domain-containing protein [Phycisphaerae bacterium]
MSDHATTESGGAALVEVRDLVTVYGTGTGRLGRARAGLRAVDGVSLDIPAGTTLGLVGESGCGKTTLGRSILRLVEPTSGEVRFAGHDVLGASGTQLRRLRRDMQIVFQDPFGSLNPRLTVGTIVGEPLVLHRWRSRRERRERATELLERVGLRGDDAGRYPHEFSGGQRQRIGIARALALEPRFIVCDEPVSALDVSVQAQILNLLADLQGEWRLTYLFIAHNLAVVEQFCARVAVMYRGRIVEVGPATEVCEAPRHPYTMLLRRSVPVPDPARRVTGEVWPRSDGARAGEAETAGGCVYGPRCPFATDLCSRATPTLSSVNDAPSRHAVACHHVATIPSFEPVAANCGTIGP